MANILLILFLFCFINFGNATPTTHNQDKTDKEQQYCVSNIEQDPQILLEQCLDAKDWALSNGLVKLVVVSTCPECRTKTEKPNVMTQFSPLSLYPSPFPRKLFQQAVDVQKAMLLLYFRASRDYEFLKEAHREVLNSEIDGGIKKLVTRLDGLLSDGIRQPVTMFCQRADYMASENDDGQYELKQVEVNAGAIGCFAIASRFPRLHRRMVSNAGIDASESVMPSDQTDTLVAETLYQAWLEFGNAEAVILFLHGSAHGHLLLESRQIQHQLESIATEGIKCRFLTIKEGGLNRLSLDPDNFSLILDNKYVVAVVFDRIGERVSKEESDLITRTIFRSTAIQTPYAFLALAHTKRMQQVFTRPGMVEKFFNNPEEAHMAEAIRQVQTKAWAIGEDKDVTEDIIKKATENPQKYVLKSNECSSEIAGNFFNEDIPKKLATMAPADRDFFLLTEKLRPMVVKNHFIRPNTEPALNVDATPELGIFGCLIGNMETGKVSYFSRTGHMMKTKLASVEEGSVWKGYSVGDSPYLV
uniref:Glutathione synthetase n=1 Tax=Globodera rostochiensis TaxID=31243 RepID=A0A914IEJ0_GLORO